MQDSDYHFNPAGIGYAGALFLAVAIGLFYIATTEFNPAAIIFGIILTALGINGIWFECSRYKGYKQKDQS